MTLTDETLVFESIVDFYSITFGMLKPEIKQQTISNQEKAEKCDNEHNVHFVKYCIQRRFDAEKELSELKARIENFNPHDLKQCLVRNDQKDILQSEIYLLASTENIKQKLLEKEK